MGSPGGEEVGRVSIRVVPDTSGFRRELQNAVRAAEAGIKVTIPGEVDLDTAGFRAQLAALENARVTVPVDFDPDLARLRAQLAALDNAKITIPVEFDLRDINRINTVVASLNNRRVRINVQLHGVRQAIRDLTALDALVRRLDGRRINIHIDVDAGAAIAQIAAIEAALVGVRASLGNVGTSGGRAFGGMASGALSAVGALAVIPPLAAAIAVAGAGITAAWGAASTAVAAIGPAVMLLAAPIAAIALGMDGITKAAKTIKPEFDALKTAVSATFEKHMVPVFQTLTKLFPTLTTGLTNSARAVSFLAQSMANMLTSTPGLALISKTFENINFALLQMHPGIESVMQGFLLLGAQTSIFDALVKGVNTFGEEFRRSVIDVIADGTLDAAMAGLGESLAALSRGFVSLVENGIKLFAAAAPGVNQVIDSITNFFNRFDWASLGTSVSGVFSGLAEAIDSIPPGTIDAIEQSFSRLAEAFKDPAFAQGVRDIADSIPLAVDAISGFVGEFDEIAAGVKVALEALTSLQTGFQNLAGIVETSANDIRTKWASGLGLDTGDPLGLAAFDDYVENQIRALFGLPPVEAEKGGIGTREGWERGLRGGGGTFGEPVEKELETVPKAFESGLAPVPGAVTKGMTPAGQALADAIAQMPPIVQEGFGQFGAAVGTGLVAITQAISNETAQWTVAISTGMTAMQTTAATGVTGMATAMTTGFSTVTAAATTGMDQATLAISTGTANWVVAITTGMTAVTDTLTAQSVNWTTAIQTGMTAMQTTITTGFSTTILAAATTGMDQITLAIATGTANWVVAITTGMTALTTTIQTGFATTVVAAATVGMDQVTLAIATGTANWVVAIQTGMTALQLAMDAGFVQLATSATNGTVAIQTAITAGFVAIAASVSLAMNTLSNTVVAGFETMKTAVANGLTAVQNQFTNGWATIGTGLQTAMNNCNTIVRTGMTNMVTDATNGMTNVTNAVTQGMNQSVQAVTSGIARMVNTLRSAVGQFRAAGAAMGQGLVDGLNSKLGAVQAAAARLASAAAAAMRAAAQIRSPSRITTEIGQLLGAGVEVGLHDARPGIIAEARSIVDALENEFVKASKIDPSIGFDGAQVAASVRHELADTELVGAGVGGRQTTINNNFYTESSTRESAAVAQTHRRQAAMGLFG
jgi:hypothetical protein